MTATTPPPAPQSVQLSLAGSQPAKLPPSPLETWSTVLRRLPAWLSLLTVFAMILALTLESDPDAESLAGRWNVRVANADGTFVETTAELPGLFLHQGIAADARVLALRDVVVEDEPMALLVDNPLYALTATWDGVPVGSVGDPSASGRDARTSRSLFVTLPSAPAGTHHQLGLDLKGDYGKGGILGRILVGPVPAVHAAGVAIEVRRLAFSLGLSLLACLPLVVAARGTWRPTYIVFGLFASICAVQSVAQSNLAYTVLPDALSTVRLLRVVTPLIPILGLSYVTLFVHGHSRTADRVVCGAGLTLSAFALVLPGSWFYLLEVGGEALFVAGLPIYVRRVVQGLRARLSGSLLLAASVLPVLWSIASEILLTHGLDDGSGVLASGLLFVVGLGSALVLRDANTSEQHGRLVRGSLDAMVTVDTGGRIRDANPAAHRLLPPPADDAPFLHFVSDPDRPWVRAHLTRALMQADRIEFRTTQNRVLESLATPLDRETLMLTLRDITIRRELDRGLLQAARMETVALLLGGIAHDFNNMLSTLLAHLGLLRTQITDVRTRERLDRMEGAVDRASELTRRLLTVARGTGSDLVSVDLATVVAGATELVEPTLSAGVTLQIELPPNLPPVLGAPGDLEQVVVNLLMNARDAVGERGVIRVAARTFRQGDSRQGGEVGKRGVALMVEDDGPGVDPDRQEEVFQPFVTTKPHGTGLGLAVARQILRDHHGRIWVESRPGGGSRFLLALRHADAVDEAPTPMPRGRSVLLVEDEQVLLEDYGQALTEAGYTVAAFSDGTAGADWLTRNEPDLVVTDVVMPGINGLDLARLSLELHPETPVLFVSAFVPHEALRDLPEGTWQALHKPVRAARLVSTVGRIRRRCERNQSGDDDITWVNYLFPDLADLSAGRIGFDQGART